MTGYCHRHVLLQPPYTSTATSKVGQGPQGRPVTASHSQEPAVLAAFVMAQVYLVPPSVQKKGRQKLAAHFMSFTRPRLNTNAGPPLAELSQVCVQDLGSKALS